MAVRHTQRGTARNSPLTSIVVATVHLVPHTTAMVHTMDGTGQAVDVLKAPDGDLAKVARTVIETHGRVAVEIEGGGIVVMLAHDDELVADVLEDERDGAAVRAVDADPDEEYVPARQAFAELGLL